MKKFAIDKDDNRLQTINRTIRIKADYFDKITQLSEKTGVSFNKIINQCIAYALDNIEQEEID
jgi:hypothetical protein